MNSEPKMDRESPKPVVARSRITNCSRVTGMNFFSYITPHSLGDVLRSGYFALMGSGLEKFDRIEVTCCADGNKPEHATLIVSAVDPVKSHATVKLLRGATGAQS